MAEKVIIYGKEGCPYCKAAREYYGKIGEMVFIDVKADPSRLKEMLKHSKGDRTVPVILEGGKVIIGYGGG